MPAHIELGTLMAVRSQDGTIINGNEINFLGPDEATYPQLTRLYLDFDFRVLAVPDANQPDCRYLVSYKSYNATDGLAITPLFDSLTELETYTNDHIIDILHETLFESLEEE